MRRRGFTLIELLSVIVVLAIIALIATPIVLNLINNARVGAAEQSATGYVKAIENTIMKDMLNDKDISDGTYKYDYLSVDINGTAPTSGNYRVKNGKIETANFCINNYVIEYKDGKSKRNDNKKCGEDGPTIQNAKSDDTYKGIVYLDPTDLNNFCNEKNSKNITGTKEGCMKWYVYDENDSSYIMILDHNTTALVAYNSTGVNSEMKEVKGVLESDTSTWDSVLNPRLIKAEEIAHITGADKEENIKWSIDKKWGTDISDNRSSWFYFDGSGNIYSNWQKQTSNSKGASKYAWLFDNTYGCTVYGCNIEDSSAYGYWTSTPVVGVTESAWDVYRRGRLGNDTTSNTYPGLRPVITISKDIFE